MCVCVSVCVCVHPGQSKEEVKAQSHYAVVEAGSVFFFLLDTTVNGGFLFISYNLL